MDGAISIGRNVGNVPLDDERWERFVSDVQFELDLLGATIYAVAYGRGEWQSIPEENAVVTFGDLREIARFKVALQALAKRYGQDAIALVLGASELVGAA